MPIASPEVKRVIKRDQSDDERAAESKAWLDHVIGAAKHTYDATEQYRKSALPYDELECRLPPELAFEKLNGPFAPKAPIFTDEQRKADPIGCLEEFRNTNPNKCTHCSDPECVIFLDQDRCGASGSVCGLGGFTVPCDDGAPRRLKEGDEVKAKQAEAKMQASAFDQEAERARNFIDERDLGNNPSAAVLSAVQNRYAQCTVLLGKLDDGRCDPLSFGLTNDDVLKAQHWLKAAILRWGKEGCPTMTSPSPKQAASPLFWTIIVARMMLADGQGGFAMTTQDLAEQVTMDSLHDRLHVYAGETTVTGESSVAVTKGGGKDARAANEKKRRQVRIDSLGNAAARKAKIEYLEGLLIRAGMLDASKGFPHGIRNDTAPAVIGSAKNQRKALDTTLIPMNRVIATGLNKHKKQKMTPLPPPPPPPPLALPQPDDAPPPSAPPSPAPEEEGEEDSSVAGEVSP
jgi:hypothetical protein